MVNLSPAQRRLHLYLHLRGRGHRGGAILPHRSIWSHHLPMGRLAGGVLIALFFTVVLAFSQEAIAALWGQQLVWWMRALDLPGQFVLAGTAPESLFNLPVPLVDPTMPDTTPFTLAAHALACVAIWVCAGWLPDSAKPGAYLARFAVLIHGASVLYFGLWPASFPHSPINHMGGGLRQAWVLVLFTPWLHLCTYYLFPFAAWQRLAVTTVTLAFLLLLAPLQYATHAALLVLMGQVLMPLLHLLFGVMVPILGVVALYGWGMSWHDPAGHGAEA